MANNIFTRAKAYRKKHPKTPWAQCVKACAGKKAASVGKAKRKSPKTVVRAKVAVIGKAKKAGLVKRAVKSIEKAFGIGDVSMNKLSQEMRHQNDLFNSREKLRHELKTVGLSPATKNNIRRNIKHYGTLISASKKHISALKRTI